MQFGPLRMRRDVGNIQSVLVAEEQASWLEESSRLSADAHDYDRAGSVASWDVANSELERTAAAVRRLLTQG